MDVEQIFKELVQVSLGIRHCLSFTPSANEWAKLYSMAKKQSLIGVCFAGIQRLHAQYQEPPEMLYLTWMGMAAKIQQRNQVVDEQTALFYKKIADDGYKSCVLKGQAVNALYGNLRGLRQSGDIDMWMLAEPETVIEWARTTGNMYYYDYHHADLSLFKAPSTVSREPTEVELHYRPSLSRNLVRNARLQKWFKKEGTKHIIFKEELGFAVPDFIFNVMLTINHNFWHLLYEGVGMRQFMDLYFILKTLSDSTLKDEKDKTLKLLKHLKLLRFTSANMWIMKNIFGLEDEYLLCEPDQSSGKFLLNEIMQAGNFGKHDKRLKEGRYNSSRVSLMLVWLKHNLRLIKYYPIDVLWTPFGIMRISIWRRLHYRNENEMKNIL